MINFKDRDEILPSALIVFSLVVLAGTLIYMLVVPQPSDAGVIAARHRSEMQISTQIRNAKQEAETARKAVAPRLWIGGSEETSTAVLAFVSAQTAGHLVSVNAFRPQRPTQIQNVIELPFSVQMTGPYPGIRAVMGSLDQPSSKVVLRSVQVASSEQTNSTVTATLGLSAYIPADPTIVEATQAHAARAAKFTQAAKSGGARGKS